MKKKTMIRILVMLSLLFYISTIPIESEMIEPSVEETPIEIVEEVPIRVEVFKLTAYCKENYPHICNDGDSTYTATMTSPTPGRTIAVDPKEVPFGSEVEIFGNTYVAEDTGGAIKGKRIDILFETHREALEFGIQYAEVCIKEVH